MLYERHNFLNKSIPYLTSHEIVEYDIQSAGFNLTKKYQLLDEKKVNYLESLDKKQRQIQIGLYQRDDSKYKKSLNKKFKEIRGIFFEANNIQDDDVLSIKKDAIITLKRCTNLDFDNIHFIEKNEYTSYYNINHLEFYVGNNYLDVKGITDEKLELHKKYMIDFLYTVFKMIETSSRKMIIKNLKEFAFYYKERKLDIGYYRELNSDSNYKLAIQTLPKRMIIINENVLNIQDNDLIDISYNYLHYMNPLISLLI